MRKSLSTILALCVLPVICGCAPLIIGAAAGGLGAYAVSKDTVQGDSDLNFDLLWESALNIAKQRGIIQQEDIASGYIELTADSSKVWIRLIRLTQATTRIRVSARKFHFPNMDLAQDFFVKIVSGAK
ncbi:MAG: DUF3568 family protein [Candidatus Omnitrophota bacterium]|jgi:hypothetical protein